VSVFSSCCIIIIIIIITVAGEGNIGIFNKNSKVSFHISSNGLKKKKRKRNVKGDMAIDGSKKDTD
jgi:hypothetical protein